MRLFRPKIKKIEKKERLSIRKMIGRLRECGFTEIYLSKKSKKQIICMFNRFCGGRRIEPMGKLKMPKLFIHY